VDKGPGVKERTCIVTHTQRHNHNAIEKKLMWHCTQQSSHVAHLIEGGSKISISGSTPEYLDTSLKRGFKKFLDLWQEVRSQVYPLTIP
jgi:hypothetical protein